MNLQSASSSASLPDAARLAMMMGDLDAALSRVEVTVQGMTEALRAGDASAAEQQALVLRHTLATDMAVWEQALTATQVPPATRQRIALVGAALRAQRDAIARGQAAVTRELEIIVPPGALPYDDEAQTQRLQSQAMPV